MCLEVLTAHVSNTKYVLSPLSIGLLLFNTTLYMYDAWGLFLESSSNLMGPISYFEIKVSRKVGGALTSNEVYFVSFN